MSTQSTATGRASRCPICGLSLRVGCSASGPELSYDVVDWDRLCRQPALGSPSMCLAQAANSFAASQAPPSLDDRGRQRSWAKALV